MDGIVYRHMDAGQFEPPESYTPSQYASGGGSHSMGSGSVEGSLSGGDYSRILESEEGWDLEFVPNRAEKYDCPICLLVLREPMQTTCGHRFCSACILKWLRESEARCPVDNQPLDESQLFPDNFAKREILALCVKCPNHVAGCDVIVVLKHLQGITTTTTTATTTSTDARNASWPFVVPHRRRPVGANTTTDTTGTTTTLRYIFVARLTTPDYVYALVAMCTVSVSGLVIVVACIWRRRRRVLENRLPISLPATNLDDSEPETIGATLMVQLPESPRKRQRKPAHFSGSEDTLFEFTSVKLE